MESEQPSFHAHVPLSKYSKRVILKTIFDRSSDELVGERVVVGGWVKSSREVRKDPLPQPPPPVAAAGDMASGPKDVRCGESLQTRIPFFRSIMKVLGGTHNPIREKLESVTQKLPPPPSIAILQVSDGSCVSSLQVHSICSLSFLFFFLSILIYFCVYPATTVFYFNFCKMLPFTFSLHHHFIFGLEFSGVKG